MSQGLQCGLTSDIPVRLYDRKMLEFYVNGFQIHSFLVNFSRTNMDYLVCCHAWFDHLGIY